MENAYYRDNLERVLARFPGKELLSIKDVCEFTGLNFRTAKKRFPFTDKHITAATLSRCLCEGVRRP
jgi:hypothetical protein